MADTVNERLEKKIENNKVSINEIEKGIPELESNIESYSPTLKKIDNEIVSITSQINDLHNQIVILSGEGYASGCGTTVGLTTVYPDVVKSFSDNLTSSSYDGINPFGGVSSASLSSSNVGIGSFLLHVQSDSSQTGIGSLYANPGTCYQILICNSDICSSYASSITALQTQITTLRGRLGPLISDSNTIKNERRNDQIARYGSKRGLANLKSRNTEMSNAIVVIERNGPAA